MKRGLLGSLVAVVAASTLSGCFVLVERADSPRILEADAWCARDGWWEIEADVSHPDGDRDVDFVWVEVTEVWWDFWGENVTYTDLGDIDLEYAGDGLWYAEVPSEFGFLDCGWPYDYDLRFVAEDREGDTDSYTITR